MVYVYAVVEGWQNKTLSRKEYYKAFHPIEIAGKEMACHLMDHSSFFGGCNRDWLQRGFSPQKGFLKQEEIPFKKFLETPTGSLIFINILKTYISMQFQSNTTMTQILDALFASLCRTGPRCQGKLQLRWFARGWLPVKVKSSNDHIAFRTMGVPNLGIASFEKIFLSARLSKKWSFIILKPKS